MSANFSLALALHCTEENARSDGVITFTEYPETVGAVKEHIQAVFKIPVNCQRLSLDTISPLKDDNTLHSHRIRDGDTLHVYYDSSAAVDEILGVVEYMKSVAQFLELAEESSESFSNDATIEPRVIEELSSDYLMEKNKTRREANKHVFLNSGGLEVLYRIYSVLVSQPMESLPYQLQLLEYSVLRVLWNGVTGTLSVRSKAFTKETLHMWTDKLLLSLSRDPGRRVNRVAFETTYRVIGNLCK